MSERDAEQMEKILLGPAWLMSVQSIEQPHEEIYTWGQMSAVDIIPTGAPVLTVECRCIHCNAVVTAKSDGSALTLTGTKGAFSKTCDHTREELFELHEEIRDYASHYGQKRVKQYVHLRVSR